MRLRFRNEEGRWLARLADNAGSIDVVRHDLSSLPEEKWADTIEALSAAAQATLDIEQGPLLRAVHFDLGAELPGRLLLAVHHLAIDGVSWRILLEDIETAYVCLGSGSVVELSRTTSYQKWAAALADRAQDTGLAAVFPTWQAMLRPAAQLPVRAGEGLEAEANTISIELTPDETKALLQDVPAVYRTQINDALLTALATTLQRSTGGTSFLVDMEGHGREDIGDDLDLSRTVGWFTAVFPLRLELAAGIGIGGALKSIKEQLRNVPDRGLSYGLLRYCGANLSHRAALADGQHAQLLFNYLGQFDQVTRGSELFAFASESTGLWHAPNGRRTHAVEVLVQVRDNKLRIDWNFSEKLIHRASIERLAADFISTLQDIIRHCREADAGGRTPSDVPLAPLVQAEVDQLWQLFPRFLDAYPLTPMQRLFYVMERAGASVGLEQWQFRIEGQFEPQLLRLAFEQVITRHTILRTGFSATARGEPVQVVVPTVVLPWREQDCRELDADARRTELQRVLDQDAKTRFDLSCPPLMRVCLLRVADYEWQLLWTTHHLCIDGWSWPRLFKEIAEFYAALQEQRPASVEFAPDYGRYVGWLTHNPPSSPTYWKNALAGFAAPTPIALGSRAAHAPGLSAGRPSELATSLSRETTGSLQLLARASGITLGTLVQAAWALLLAHYNEFERRRVRRRVLRPTGPARRHRDADRAVRHQCTGAGEIRLR